MNIDQLLVMRCAPTLAGLKIAALVCVPVESMDQYEKMIDKYNERFNKSGLYFTTLWSCGNRQVVYIYRKQKVRDYLCQVEVAKFLTEYGYDLATDINKTIKYLAMRFHKESTFPHELGVFLGYPLEEVKAFIQYQGNDAIMCGEWKVYHNLEFAKQEFSKYEKCRKCYIEMYNQGVEVDRLVIA